MDTKFQFKRIIKNINKVRERRRADEFRRRQDDLLRKKKDGEIGEEEFQREHDRAWVDLLIDRFNNGESNELLEFFRVRLDYMENYARARDNYWRDKILTLENYKKKRTELSHLLEDTLLARGIITEKKLAKEKKELLADLWEIERQHYEDGTISAGEMCVRQTNRYWPYFNLVKEVYGGHRS